MKKYNFKVLNYKDVNPQAVGEFLELKFPNKNFTPKEVVDIARPRNSPLHKVFDWDDTIAAEKWRIQQARILISNLTIEINDDQIKAYESVNITTDTKRYVSIDTIAESQDLVAQVIERAKGDLHYWKEKYNSYRDYFSHVFNAIEQLGVKDGKKESNQGSSRRNNKDTSDRNKAGKNNNRRRHPTTSL